MWTLDQVIAVLHERAIRASYKAVTELIGSDIEPVELMNDRERNHRNSWVVSKDTDARRGAVRGRPTGYTDEQIDLRCLTQIRNREHFAETAEILRAVIGNGPPTTQAEPGAAPDPAA
jgi:hypothetical protein